MTKSELFKAAHKLAKAWKFKMGGDYVVYLARALKGISAHSKVKSKEYVFSFLNSKIKEISASLGLIRYKSTVKSSHGLKTFSHSYKFQKAKNELEDGQFFGKSYTNKSGETCAMIYSVRNTQVAY